MNHYAEGIKKLDDGIYYATQEFEEVSDQLDQVQGMIQEEEQRYHRADLSQRSKLETIQQEYDQMQQERDTLYQQLDYRKNQLSKVKRELTPVELEKE